MYGSGETELKNAMKYILNKDEASKDLLQFSENDLITVIPFNSHNYEILKSKSGTDTVDLTAQFIDGKVEGKKIVFTGAMVPMSIDEVEATMNFSQAIGFLNAPIENGIYLSMHGVVVPASKLVKNRELGQFLIS